MNALEAQLGKLERRGLGVRERQELLLKTGHDLNKCSAHEATQDALPSPTFAILKKPKGKGEMKSRSQDLGSRDCVPGS